MRAFLLSAIPVLASAQLLTPVWIQVGEHGQAIARVIVNTPPDCPTAMVDGARKRFALRQPVPIGFRPSCELLIPSGAKKASVNGQRLNLPEPNPDDIIAFGDTGCRIQGNRLQDCNDPSKWPFEQVSSAASAAKADLVLHVGDYLYREEACPADKQAECGGTPHGDNWEAWNADFFRPAAKLLASTPWVFARGNHENCQRAWRGWSYYLDTHAWTETCDRAAPPVFVELGKFQLVLFDSNATSDNLPKDLMEIYAAQLATVKMTHGWLLDHHPFWAFQGATAPGQPPRAETKGLSDAFEKGAPQGIDLIVSGHTHLFEMLSFGGPRPAQLVAGNGGTSLEERVPAKIKGMELRGFTVAGGETDVVFGYTRLKKKGDNWDLVLRNAAGKSMAHCELKGNQATCKEKK